MGQKEAGRAAEDRLGELRMAVSAHDDEIAAGLGGEVEDRRSGLMMLDDMEIGRYAVAGEMGLQATPGSKPSRV